LAQVSGDLAEAGVLWINDEQRYPESKQFIAVDHRDDVRLHVVANAAGAAPSREGGSSVNILLLAVGVLSYLLILRRRIRDHRCVGCLVLIPVVGTRLANHFIRSHQYHKGYFLASILQWFHPADGWRESPALFRALDLGSQGKFDEAVSILKEVQSSPSQLSRSATCQPIGMQGQWDELVAGSKTSSR